LREGFLLHAPRGAHRGCASSAARPAKGIRRRLERGAEAAGASAEERVCEEEHRQAAGASAEERVCEEEQSEAAGTPPEVSDELIDTGIDLSDHALPCGSCQRGEQLLADVALCEG